MHISLLTLFPDSVRPYLDASILGKAQAKGLLTVDLIDPRSFSNNPHRKVDDSPFGGGSGMVLACQPVLSAYQSLLPLAPPARILMTNPCGRRFDQALSLELSQAAHLVILCGHYEGFDERLLTLIPTIEPVSVGDFVLTGGELPALTIVDAVARHLPGVVQQADSVQNDSFYAGLLDHPHYTRPAEFEGLPVPEPLLSGHHGRVAAWRRLQALWRTWRYRPDLLVTASLSPKELKLLARFDQGDAFDTVWQQIDPVAR
jgi:tRNA (guanine37-N1)-methyltransferase